jgi:dihydrofolate reductase
MSLNRVIGKDGKIPWHIPEELQWFKEVTTGHVIVMGRKTFASIGKPLPRRVNVVLTRQALNIPGVITVPDLGSLPEYPRQKIFLIGGAQVYEAYLSQCSELLLTIVQQQVDGDAFFPSFEDQFTEAGVIRENDRFLVKRFIRHGSRL